jgi:hypothetical protein
VYAEILNEGGRIMRVLLLSLALLSLPLSAHSAETPASKSGQAWPATVHASYSLRFNGIEVGTLDFKSNTTANTYTLASSGKVSVFFGAFKWSGSSSASGAIEGGSPAPAAYRFDWRQNDKKGGNTQIGFKEHIASEINIKPAPRPKSDMVPLLPTHRVDAVDPMSAVMALTKPDGRPPCDRRVGIFDGKHRYDIVLTPKGTTKLALSSVAGGRSETAHVCRVTWEPIAGHRDNEDTKAFAANRDVEIVLRRIPGTQTLVPYSVSIPTGWGTGYMVAKRIEVVTAGAKKIALTD